MSETAKPEKPIKLIEQKRATYALSRVQENKEKEGFRSYARQFPATIQANGLGQAVAFYRSRGNGDTHEILYSILSDWLCGEGQVYHGYKDLLDAITQSDMLRYRRAQAEAQALLIWVKRFAEAFCTKKKMSDKNNAYGDEINERGAE